MSDLAKLLGRDYYEELKTQQLLNKVRKGDYMPPLYDWLKEVNPTYNWDWPFQNYAIKKLQDFTDGKIDKLMVFSPPRIGKSELISVHFPAYILERNPTDRVILATYNQTLANKMSRKVRALARTRVPLDPERAAMEEWDTKEGGGLRAVGVGAGVTGVGGNCLTGDTLITTETGQMRIKDFFTQREVPKVLSYNTHTKKTEYKNVIAGKVSQTDAIYRIKTGSTIVEATAEHLFYNPYEGKYIPANRLDINNTLLNENYHVEPIISIEKISGSKLVYDIQVEDNHNFFANGLLVHNCIIIDDPVRSRKDASSPTVRRTTWEWYQDDLRTRLEPGGRIAILMTRWHEQDLCGMLLEHEPELWDVVRLPALAEENDPLGRKVGESINPERFSREDFLEIKKTMGRSFYALYQQRPQEQEGEFFKASWFEKLDKLPELEENEKYEYVRYWDKAATTEDRSDYTVGVLMCKNRKTGYYYIIDVVRGKWMPHARDKIILRTAQKDQELYGHVRIFHEEEPGSSGKDAAKQTNQLLSGYSVKAIKSTGNKQLRSEPYQSQCEAKNVFLIKAQWNADFIDEHATFPLGGHDDIVDAAAGAFSQLTKGKGFISIGDRFR